MAALLIEPNKKKTLPSDEIISQAVGACGGTVQRIDRAEDAKRVTVTYTGNFNAGTLQYELGKASDGKQSDWSVTIL